MILSILYVFSLGLLSTIHPCQLLINAGATAYLSKDMTNKTDLVRNSFFYTLGRITTYTLLATVLYFGFTALDIRAWFEASGERYAGILMLFIGTRRYFKSFAVKRYVPGIIIAPSLHSAIEQAQ